jgi:hypothetical protein
MEAASSRSAFGGFLDELPNTLYVLAHVVFLIVGIVLWVRTPEAGPMPHIALLLYVASQVVFLGFFANWITLKMAVLTEQTLMLVMVCLFVIGKG